MKGITAKGLSSVLLVSVLVLAQLVFALTEEWVARYDWPPKGHDKAKDIAVDGYGNVYVTGQSELVCTTIKYDANGNELWVARSIGGFGNKLVLDGDGNVYVIGTGSCHWFIIKHDSNGNELWIAEYGADGSSPCGIAVDGDGNVYVTGYNFFGETADTMDSVTIKYDSDGNELWVARYSGPAGKEDSTADIALDGNGNVYVTGRCDYSVENRDSDWVAIKYDTNGNELWVARYDGSGSGFTYDVAIDLAIDGDSNVYVTGKSDNDFATIKYDTNGNELWVARYGLQDKEDLGLKIAVDLHGNVYVAGISYYDYMTIKYDADGNELWISRYGQGLDYAKDLAIDGDSNVYVTGKSDNDFATIKYDTNGNELWVARHDGSGDYEDSGSDIAVDGDGNVYVTGFSQVSGYPDWDYDYVTIKYSQDEPVIDKIGNRTCYPGEKIKIKGSGFGDEQGDSVVHINQITYDSTSSRIKLWTDTLIKVKILFTGKDCSWFKHGDGEYRRRKVWVTVGGENSNKKTVKVLRPGDCN